jgi:hypothetical protein
VEVNDLQVWAHFHHWSSHRRDAAVEEFNNGQFRANADSAVNKGDGATIISC